jgi:predicted enzyme related to lactoylglutathione lyase
VPDRDPFVDLRRPIAPVAPRPSFATSLRHRLEEELAMPSTVPTASAASAASAGTGDLVMVHLRVDDADRAERFFSSLFGWETERHVVEGHVSHYSLNTAPTVRLLSDPGVPAVVPNYGVADVGEAVRTVEARGGRVTESGAEPDGGGWARGEDDQGLPFLVYRPGGYEDHPAPTREPSGDVGLVFIRADHDRAQAFYGALLGWRLRSGHPDSRYYDTVARVGIFDEAAALGTEVTPGATVFFEVDRLQPALARLAELGGHPGPVEHTMGPYHSAVCTDDQGTEFGLMSPEPD